MTALLDVRDVSRRFAVQRGPRGTTRWLHAVEDVSFDVKPAECVGLVGESGCGKSTLVRLVTRLLDPTEGRIWFDGQYLEEVPAARLPARNAAIACRALGSPCRTRLRSGPSRRA